MVRFLFALLLLAAVAAGAVYWERNNFFAPGPSPKGVVVLVEPGDHVSVIAQHLQDAGAISNAQLFSFGLRVRSQQTLLKAGEYWIPPRASMASIAGILISGRSIDHKITAAEGLTSAMIYALVRANPVLVGDAGPEPAEGTLLPETYLFTRGMTRAEMLAHMAKAQKTLVEKLWPARAATLPLTSRAQAITLASIVEKETAIPEERRHIASVFVNRLKLGMKLQSDPTIIYGISKGYPLGRGIRESELNKATPYNTYLIAGLPPTPICNPGRDSIAAVLQPANSSDLYFVANGKGGHVFSATIAQHEQNVAKWRQIEGHAAPPTPTVAPVVAPPAAPALRSTSESETPTAPSANAASPTAPVTSATATMPPPKHRAVRRHRRHHR
ncbi:MAG TPA: endolytic transglycosylase MltG [Rhizomicrobium sp.]|jgi:UPF0755 protein